MQEEGGEDNEDDTIDIDEGEDVVDVHVVEDVDSVTENDQESVEDE